MWYRGTGVGPYPCMSALQALERVVRSADRCRDSAGEHRRHPPRRVREPRHGGPRCGDACPPSRRRRSSAWIRTCRSRVIWHQEFGRMVHESSGLGGVLRRHRPCRSTPVVSPRSGDAGLCSVLTRHGRRRFARIGDRLVRGTDRMGGRAGAWREPPTKARWTGNWSRCGRGRAVSTRDTTKPRRRRAACTSRVDRRTMLLRRWRTATRISRRAQEATRLMVRYHVHPRQGIREPLAADDLVSDLVIAKDLLENPPALNPTGPWDMPAAVAAAALEAHIVDGVDLPTESLRFAVDVVLRVGLGEPASATVRVRGVLLRAGWRPQRGACAPSAPSALCGAHCARWSTARDGSQTYEQATSAALNLARAEVREVRVHLARGLDRLWEAPLRSRRAMPPRDGAPDRHRDDAGLRTW